MTTRRFPELAHDLVARTPLRAKSLIVTVFGDAIAPHGGTVWLGSLIKLLAPFGLNERLVRTAVLRLSREDWFASRQIGRRSYYSLTESGRRRFEDAHRRIYASPSRRWDGLWTLAILGLGGMDAVRRDRVRRELVWLGFGAIGPNCMAHPAADHAATRHILQDHQAESEVALLRAESLDGNAPWPMLDLVRACWDLDQLGEAYRGFLDRFRPRSPIRTPIPRRVSSPGRC